jgi:hypothetical protein
MKNTGIKLALALTLGASMLAAGCGHSNDSSTPIASPGYVAGAPVIQPGYPGYPTGVPGGALPVGCYYTGMSSAACTPCPTGWTQQAFNGANYCVSGGAANMCGVNQYYNGYTGQCQSVSSGAYYWYGCPSGTTWSQAYGGCISTQPPANCSYKSYLSGLITTYVCS